jgi:hypothetical protein
VTAVRLESIKSQIHREILAQVDLRRMETISPEALRLELKTLAQSLLDDSGLAINGLNVIRLSRASRMKCSVWGP